MRKKIVRIYDDMLSKLVVVDSIKKFIYLRRKKLKKSEMFTTNCYFQTHFVDVNL